MGIELTPSNRVHTTQDVTANETQLQDNDSLVILTAQQLSEVANQLDHVSTKVDEFDERLTNTIDVNGLSKLKEQLGDVDSLNSETIIGCLVKVRDALLYKASGRDIEVIDNILLTKADNEDLNAVKEELGSDPINENISQTVKGALNDLLAKIDTLVADVETKATKTGDTLTGKLSYGENVTYFTDSDIPSLMEVKSKIIDVVGNLAETGLTNISTVTSVVKELNETINLLKQNSENTILSIGDLTGTGIPESSNGSVSQSLQYLNTKYVAMEGDLTVNKGKISALETGKADASVVEAISEELALVKGAKVIVTILTDNKETIEAMEADAKQTYLTEKAKEAGRKTMKDGFEIRTSDAYSYYYFKGTWYYVDKLEVTNASLTTSGLIKLKDEEGSLVATEDNDGSVKVKGFTELKDEVIAMQHSIDEKVDKAAFSAFNADRNKQVELIAKAIDKNTLKVKELDSVSREALAIATAADTLSKQNNQSIIDNQDRIQIIENSATTANRNASDALAKAKEAKNVADRATVTAEDAARAASNSASSASETKIYASRMENMIGDLNQTGYTSTLSVADALGESYREETKIKEKLDNVNANIFDVFRNGKNTSGGSFTSDTCVYRKPTMVVDNRGVQHLFAEYAASSAETAISDIVYAASKTGFSTYSTKVLMQRVAAGVNNANDLYSRLKAPTAVYDKVNDKIYVLIGCWLDGDVDWTANQTIANWKYSKLAVGSWNPIAGNYNWEEKTIGGVRCDINIANFPAACKAFYGLTGNGIIHPDTNEIIFGVQYTTFNNDIINGVIRSTDGVNWTWAGDDMVLAGLSDGAIFTSLVGTDNKFVILSKSTADYGLKARQSVDGNTWSTYAALNDKLAGYKLSSQCSALNIESSTGRKYTVLASTNYVNNYPHSKTRLQNSIDLYLVSEKSQSIIPAGTVYNTGYVAVPTGKTYDFYTTLAYERDGNGDRLYIGFENTKGIKVGNITSMLSRVDALSDKFDDSLVGLSAKQIEEVKAIGLSSASGTFDAINLKLEELKTKDTEITEAINKVRGMLEGSLKGIRFVGIIDRTKAAIEFNKQLLTDFVNARFTDPLERLRGGDIVATKDKYTYVYLRNDLGQMEWTIYNDDANVTDILNRLDALEAAKGTIETAIQELTTFKATQEALNTTTTAKVDGAVASAGALTAKVGDLTNTGITNNTSVTAMLKEVNDKILSANIEINGIKDKVGNLGTTGLTDTSSVSGGLKELNDKLLHYSNTNTVQTRLDQVEYEAQQAKQMVGDLQTKFSQALNGVRLLGICPYTKDEVELNEQLLTAYVSTVIPGGSPELGDVLTTTDKYPFAYTVKPGGQRGWMIYSNTDVDLTPIITRLDANDLTLGNLKTNYNSLVAKDQTFESQILDLQAKDSLTDATINTLTSKDVELAAKDQEILNTIGALNTTGFINTTSVTEVLKEVKNKITTLEGSVGNGVNLIGDLSATGIPAGNNSTVETSLSYLKTGYDTTCGNIGTINGKIAALESSKADTTAIDTLTEKLELISGARITVDVIAETKDQVEGKGSGKGTFLDQKVVEAGRSEVKDGFEIRTSDGYGFYRWKGTWYLIPSQQIAVATTSSAGIVKFKDAEGYITTGDGDGTAKVRGFDTLSASVDANTAALLQKVDLSTFNQHVSNTSQAIQAVESKVTAVENSISGVESKVGTLTGKVTTIESTLANKADSSVIGTLGDLTSSGISNTTNLVEVIKELKALIDALSAQVNAPYVPRGLVAELEVNKNVN